MALAIAPAEIVKPAVGGQISLFGGLLMEYLNVTTPIFVAACFGALVAVAMSGKYKEFDFQGWLIPPHLVALCVWFFGTIGACYGYRLIEPYTGMKLDQMPATAVLAFVLVYFAPIILDVIKSRIQAYKK